MMCICAHMQYMYIHMCVCVCVFSREKLGIESSLTIIGVVSGEGCIVKQHLSLS